MNSRLAKVVRPLLTPAGLLVLVVILGVSFVATVLIPGLELAGEVAESSTALKLLGDQQRHPTLIRASLEAVHDRLGSRGYVQESLDDLRASTSKLEAALHEMTAPKPPSWFSLTGDTYSLNADTGTTGTTGASMAGKHAALLLDSWAKELVVLNPVLAYHGVPYQDNESTGTNLNESGRELELRVNAALRTSRHVLPLLDSEFTAMAAELPATKLRSATELPLVMSPGLIIPIGLVVLVTVLLSARQRQENSLRQGRQP